MMLVVVLGVLAGALAGLFGKGLAPREPQLIETVGTIQLVVPQLSARKLSEVGSFVVELLQPDDFGRIYVNNYLVAERDLAPKYIDQVETLGPEQIQDFRSHLTQRYNWGIGPFDAVEFLHRGKNYLVVEIENSEWAPCGGRFSLKINGVPPPGFPATLGSAFGPEPVVLNAKLGKVMRAISEDSRREKSTNRWWFWTSNAICSRKIYEIDLE